MAKKKKSSAGSFFLGAALGAAAGTVTGILTAPKSGKQTRADIVREGKKVARKAKAGSKKLVKGVEKEFKKVTTSGGNKKKKTTKARK